MRNERKTYLAGVQPAVNRAKKGTRVLLGHITKLFHRLAYLGLSAVRFYASFLRAGYMHLGEIQNYRKDGPVILYTWKSQRTAAYFALALFKDLRAFIWVSPSGAAHALGAKTLPETMASAAEPLAFGSVLVVIADADGPAGRVPEWLVRRALADNAALVPFTAQSRQGTLVPGTQIDFTVGPRVEFATPPLTDDRALAEAVFKAEFALSGLSKPPR